MIAGLSVLARVLSVCLCLCPCSQPFRIREAELCAVTYRGTRSPHNLSGTLTQVRWVLDFGTEKNFKMSWRGAELEALKDICKYSGEKERSVGKGKYTLERVVGTWKMWVSREGNIREESPRDKHPGRKPGRWKAPGSLNPERTSYSGRSHQPASIKTLCFFPSLSSDFLVF